jgi:hypothetical protein
MVYLQVGENVLVWRLEKYELCIVFDLLKDLYLFCFDDMPLRLTMEELLILETKDTLENTSFIPHFTIVKNDNNPMPHITLKIKRVKIHWGWGVTRENYAD